MGKKVVRRYEVAKVGVSSANSSDLDVATETEASRSASPSPPDGSVEGQGFKPPTGLKRFVLRKVGDWPLYSFFLAIVCSIAPPAQHHADNPQGQIIAANSYQIT